MYIRSLDATGFLYFPSFPFGYRIAVDFFPYLSNHFHLSLHITQVFIFFHHDVLLFLSGFRYCTAFMYIWCTRTVKLASVSRKLDTRECCQTLCGFRLQSGAGRHWAHETKVHTVRFCREPFSSSTRRWYKEAVFSGQWRNMPAGPEPEDCSRQRRCKPLMVEESWSISIVY